MLFVSNLDYYTHMSMPFPFGDFKYSNEFYVWFDGSYTLVEVRAHCTLHINGIRIPSLPSLKNATDCFSMLENHPNEFLSNFRDFFDVTSFSTP